MDKVVNWIIGVVVAIIVAIVVILGISLTVPKFSFKSEGKNAKVTTTLSAQVPSECKHIEFVNGGNTMLAFDDAKIEIAVSKTRTMVSNIDDKNNSVQFIVYKVNGYNCKSNRSETVEIVDSESLAIWFIR